MVNPTSRAWFVRLRDRAMAKLGTECSGCGIGDPRVLTIDHVDGRGCDERRRLSPSKVLARVLEHPEEYQLLCHNCQHLKRVEKREHRAPEYDVEMIQQMRREGQTQDEIAAQLGCHRLTVQRLLKAYGDPGSRSESQRRRRARERS